MARAIPDDADGRLSACSSKFRELGLLFGSVLARGTPIERILAVLADGEAVPEDSPGSQSWHGTAGPKPRHPVEPIELRLKADTWIQIRQHRGRDGTFALVAIDITELKRREEMLREDRDNLEQRIAERTAELQEAMEHAERASETTTQFMAQMSHELRTPLNAIIGFSEIVRAEMFGPVGTPVYSEYAKDIFSSAHHLLELINDLLDLSKIESAEFELCDDLLALSELLAEVVHIVAQSAVEKRLSFEIETEQEDLPLLRADRRANKQILFNLFSNAVKFTPEHGTVAAGVQVDDRGIAVVIQDTRVGIEPHSIDKILSPYGRIADPLVANENGPGLGLPIAKSLVELHGGKLHIESEKNRGTTVTARYPPRRAATATTKELLQPLETVIDRSEAGEMPKTVVS